MLGAAGFVTPIAAIIIGFLAGVGRFFAVGVPVRGRVDDALDVFGAHGVGVGGLRAPGGAGLRRRYQRCTGLYA